MMRNLITKQNFKIMMIFLMIMMTGPNKMKIQYSIKQIENELFKNDF